MPAVINVMKEEASLVTLVKPQFEAQRSQDKEPNQSEDNGRDVEMCDAEILDELATSRGELKLRSVSFSDNVLSSWEGNLERQIF